MMDLYPPGIKNGTAQASYPMLDLARSAEARPFGMPMIANASDQLKVHCTHMIKARDENIQTYFSTDIPAIDEVVIQNLHSCAYHKLS